MKKKRRVYRCVCHRRSFKTLKDYARQKEIDSVDELVDQRICGCGCGMCIPYVKLMLETGKVEFKPSDIYAYNDPV